MNGISEQEPITYEASRALKSTWGQPDKIHWDKHYAFRESPYRLLHHQKGLSGTFRVQLLEAKDLQRSYWSALALGPVKHLGLSKAHGNVSAFCTLELQFHSPNNDTDLINNHKKGKKVVSPVVPNQNSPVWPHSEWELPLHKGLEDGTQVMLSVQAIEESSAADSTLPLLTPGDDDRILGSGQLDITPLCLGECQGQTLIGVMDEWIALEKRDKPTGQVRVLVSYQPHGLTPQPNDLVALEAFARRSLAKSSCLPVLAPLQPLKVLQTSGDYLLVEYRLRNQERATLRIHRKAVFVIERFNILDGAVNLVMLPADVFLATPVGRTVQSVASPVVDATGELFMPALLSVKLIWGAVRTTGLAALSGVFAATGAVIHHSKESHENRQRQKSFEQPVHAQV
jgi:hypothetical protein